MVHFTHSSTDSGCISSPNALYLIQRKEGLLLFAKQLRRVRLAPIAGQYAWYSCSRAVCARSRTSFDRDHRLDMKSCQHRFAKCEHCTQSPQRSTVACISSQASKTRLNESHYRWIDIWYWTLSFEKWERLSRVAAYLRRSGSDRIYKQLKRLDRAGQRDFRHTFKPHPTGKPDWWGLSSINARACFL